MNITLTLKSTIFFPIPFSPTKINHYSLPIQLPNPKFPSFHLNPPSAQRETTSPQTIDFQDEFDEQFEDEEIEDEDDDIVVPLSNMKQWTRNKPRGFGEGKVYDTSLEEKLLEELEQSRAAQVVNVNNLKNNPIHGNPNSKKELKQKEPAVVPNGIRVRLINLPKKKNIHRDLLAALKPFTGIINIIPAVFGNEKTREPVCKGFAFVDFKSQNEAKRFVDIISTQPITFGKVQKQIRCEIMKSSSPNSVSDKPSVHRTESPLPVLNVTMTVKPVNANPVTETQVDPYVEDAAFDMLKDGDVDLVSATDDDSDDDFGILHNAVQEKHEPEAGSESLKKEKKVSEKGKKKTVTKKKVEKGRKPTIPGSASRLKMKEKALLSGVFSKYGGKSSD